jgi:hypothetical protein
MDQFQRFLKDRLAAEEEYYTARTGIEQMDAEARKAFVQGQYAQLMEMDLIHDEERQAAELAVRQALKAITDQEAADQRSAHEEMAKTIKTYADTAVFALGSLSDAISALAGDNEAAAYAAKGLASAEAGINSYLAFTKALAQGGILGVVAAGGVLAAGLAAQVKIWNTKIPGAETGGSFIAPYTGRVDGSLVRVNDGEQIDITPAGEAGYSDFGGSGQTFIFKINDQTIFDVVNRGLRSGNIHEFSPGWNVGAAQ